MDLNVRRRRQDRAAAWFPVVLLASLAAIGFWLDSKVQSSVQAKAQVEANTPEHFVERFTARRFDAQGAPSQQLKAERGTFFAQLNQSVIERPVMASRSAERAPIDITAKQAVVIGRSERVDFSGGVHAVQAAHKGQPELTVDTERLSLDPKTHVVTSQEKVRLTRPDGIAELQGLRVDGKAQNFQSTGGIRLELPGDKR